MIKRNTSPTNTIVKLRSINNIEKIAVAKNNFEMSVSPNPAHEFLNVQFSVAKSGQIKLDLISVDAKINYNLLQQKINVGAQKMNIILPAEILPGMYFLKLTTAEGSSVKKILIE